MSHQADFFSTERRPALSFAGILAWGAMIATLCVLVYACLLSPEALVRVRVILQGAQVIVLTLAAGVLAGALHSASLAAEQRDHEARHSAVRQSLAAQ